MPEAASMEIKTASFQQGGAIPRKYTGEGDDISPELAWSGLPEGTRELALVCHDPDAPYLNGWVHWVVYKIPAASNGIPEGGAEGYLEGVTDFGRTGYGGPMPPVGHGPHHYFFWLYALDASLEAASGLTRAELLKKIEGHVIKQVRLLGTYERR